MDNDPEQQLPATGPGVPPRTPALPTINEPADQTPPRNSISSLLFITLILFLLNGSGDDFTTQSQFRSSLQSLVYKHSNFSAWLNGTESNFTLDTFPAARLPLLHQFLPAPDPLDFSRQSYYNNVSGIIKGSAEPYNLTYPIPESSWAPLAESFMVGTNLTEASERLGKWNWSATEDVMIVLAEVEAPGDWGINVVHGSVELSGKNLPSSLTFRFEGVHFPSNGTVFALAEPQGRGIDARQITSLVPPDALNATAHVIDAEIATRLKRFRKMVDTGTVRTETDLNKITTCPFQMYGQVHPSSIPQFAMDEVEQEMDQPTGVSVPRTPLLKLDVVLLSQECGVLLRLGGLNGLKYQRLWRKATTFAGFACVAYLVLLVSTIRQTEATRSAAGISRASRWTFAAQAFADVYSCALYVLIAANASERSSYPVLAPGFLASVLAFFELRYMALIHNVQAPENEAMQPAAPTPTNTQASAPSPALVASGVMARRFETFVSNVTEPHSKFWIILLCGLLGFVRLTFAAPIVILLIAVIYSFWVPQIVRNSKRNTRRSLQKRYVVGTTISRLFFALYVFGCPRNILPLEATRWIWLVVGWQTIQVLILFGQEYFGPRFFLPKSWKAPDGYNYHPPVQVSDPEAPEHNLGDCSICMEPIIVHQEYTDSQLQEKASLLMATGLRRPYAVAPCSHLFHTTCLERWLAIKHICPQCRRPLPPM